MWSYVRRVRKNRTRGFTLLEVMVSIVILGVLVLGGAASLQYSGSTIQKQKGRRAALALAMTEMEASIHGHGLSSLDAETDQITGRGSKTWSKEIGGRNFVITRLVLSETDGVRVYLSVDYAGMDPVELSYKGVL